MPRSRTPNGPTTGGAAGRRRRGAGAPTGFVDLDLGVVGLHPNGSPQAVEVRAFFPNDGSTVEDPVTRSLIVALGPWLLRTGRVTVPYVVSQGTAFRRAGRVCVSRDSDGAIWVGGATVTRITGRVDISLER